ncbi:MAG: LuxR C-terminal-related transcriptional regulator [Acidimicrobiales bacterium]
MPSPTGCAGHCWSRTCPPRLTSTSAPASWSSTSTAGPGRSLPRPSVGSRRLSRSRLRRRQSSQRWCRPSLPGPAPWPLARTRWACRPVRGSQTRSGRWLLLYGTPLSGRGHGRAAVVIQPAQASEVAPIVALAYGLTDRERQVTRLCMHGRSTKAMAQALNVSPYNRPGPPQVDLRQDRCVYPRRVGGPDLPRALRSPLGRGLGRARRLVVTARRWLAVEGAATPGPSRPGIAGPADVEE